VIGNAVRVMEIATGQRDEEYEDDPGKNKAAAKLGRKGGTFEKRPTQALREARRPSNGWAQLLGRRQQTGPHAMIRLAEERVGHYRALIHEMQEAQR
jgi:hypothetical protein